MGVFSGVETPRLLDPRRVINYKTEINPGQSSVSILSPPLSKRALNSPGTGFDMGTSTVCLLPQGNATKK